MTFDKAFEMLNLDTKNMGYWTLVQIALIRKVMSGLRKTYAKPVEMTQEQKEIILTMKEQGDSGFNLVTHIEFYAFNRDDLMRAWLNTDVIKVVE